MLIWRPIRPTFLVVSNVYTSDKRKSACKQNLRQKTKKVIKKTKNNITFSENLMTSSKL